MASLGEVSAQIYASVGKEEQAIGAGNGALGSFGQGVDAVTAVAAAVEEAVGRLESAQGHLDKASGEYHNAAETAESATGILSSALEGSVSATTSGDEAKTAYKNNQDYLSGTGEKAQDYSKRAESVAASVGSLLTELQQLRDELLAAKQDAESSQNAMPIATQKAIQAAADITVKPV